MQQSESQSVQAPTASAEKQPYQQPELRCYGSVTEITLGTGGVRLDGRVNTRKS